MSSYYNQRYKKYFITNFQEIISYYLSRDGETLQLHRLYLQDSMDPSAFNLSEWIQVIKRRKSGASDKR